MAKKFDISNLNRIATDPIMDQTINAIVGAPAEEQNASVPDLKEVSGKQKEVNRKKSSKKKPAADPEPHATYNYKKTEMEVAGVGFIEKVVSEKGKIIGRPNTPIKEKKRPITLTLKPELYDMVKERAMSDHRTTSEYLAMIIEDYLTG